MQYAKLISRSQIQYPPKNFVTEDGITIFNFDKDENALIANGYKKVVVAQHEDGKCYKTTYTETETQILEILEDITEEIEREDEEKRKQEIQQLSLTKREVFLALYKDKGIIPAQIRAQITNEEALIEFDYAERYYRGNPLINALGATLGYLEEDLDYLFQNGELPSNIEEN